MRTGTTTLKECLNCGFDTMDENGTCHHPHCNDDEAGEREFMAAEAKNRDLTEDERLIYTL